MKQFSVDTKIVKTVGEFKLTKRFKDKTGFTNGYITVLEIAGKNLHSQIVWKCECKACGRQDVYIASGDLNRNISCGCARNNVNKLSTHPHHQTKEQSPYWKGYGEISGYKFCKIKDTALKRNIDFNISIEEIWELFLNQNRTCALSGAKLEFGTRGNELGTASLDRIDSNKGYIAGNVQWVHKHINLMKLDLEQDYFIELCSMVANTKRSLLK